MFSRDESMTISTRLSYGESASSVFADLRQSLLSGKITADHLIKCYNKALILFHVPYEVSLKGISESMRLAEDCLTEFEKNKDLFERADVKNATISRNRDDKVENFDNYAGETFACLFASHHLELKGIAAQQAAIKFTLEILFRHPDILMSALAKLDACSDDPNFGNFPSLIGGAMDELRKASKVFLQRPPGQRTSAFLSLFYAQ